MTKAVASPLAESSHDTNDDFELLDPLHFVDTKREVTIKKKPKKKKTRPRRE